MKVSELKPCLNCGRDPDRAADTPLIDSKKYDSHVSCKCGFSIWLMKGKRHEAHETWNRLYTAVQRTAYLDEHGKIYSSAFEKLRKWLGKSWEVSRHKINTFMHKDSHRLITVDYGLVTYWRDKYKIDEYKIVAVPASKKALDFIIHDEDAD